MIRSTVGDDGGVVEASGDLLGGQEVGFLVESEKNVVFYGSQTKRKSLKTQLPRTAIRRGPLPGSKASSPVTRNLSEPPDLDTRQIQSAFWEKSKEA